MSIESNELFIPSLRLFGEHLNDGKTAETIFDIVLSALVNPETMHFKFISATSKFRINSPVPEIVGFWKNFYYAFHKGMKMSDFLTSISIEKSALCERITEAENSGQVSVVLGQLKSDRKLEWKEDKHQEFCLGYDIEEANDSPLNEFANFILTSAIDGGASKIIIGGVPSDDEETVCCPPELDQALNKHRYDYEFVSSSDQGDELERPIFFLTHMGWVDAFLIPDSIVQRLTNIILIMADHLYWDEPNDAMNFDIRLENGHFVTCKISLSTNGSRTASISLQRYLRRFVEVEKYTTEDLKPTSLFG